MELVLRSILLSALAGFSLGSVFQPSPCTVEPYVCGLEYMPALVEAMEQATTDIIFQGWKFEMTTPLLGADKNVTFLSAVERAVARGVNVYVLLWKNTISQPADYWKIMGFHITKAARALKKVGAKVLVDKGHPQTFLERWEPSLRWSYHMKAVVVDQKRVFITGIDIAESRVDSGDHRWPDPRRAKLKGSETGYNEFWQDTALRAEGQIAFDVAKLAVQRWNDSCKLARSLRFSDCKQVDRPVLRLPTPVQSSQTCGVKLSATPFMLDVPGTVHEIEEEYISTILDAKRTVFIENLYLSSELLGEKTGFLNWGTADSKNGILRAIWTRLKRAVDEGQLDGSFSVVIILPAATEEAFTQGINMQSIWDKNRGLIYTLQGYLVERGHSQEVWKKLLRVFCLGTVNTMDNGHWNYMNIYIHTKVLIVDSEVAVVGSANLNDRSMLGTGDAELNFRIDGPEFATALQRKLLKYHAPSGYDEGKFAASLGQVADANWATLARAWPERFDANVRKFKHPVFARHEVGKATFGMFVPREPGQKPVLDGQLLPWREDLWGFPEDWGLWERTVDDLPFLGPAVRAPNPMDEGTSDVASLYV